MKVTPEHLDTLRTAIEPFDTDERRERYRALDFPRADRVQDLNKRYRWDLFNEADRASGRPHLTTTMYVANYTDAHIDTALRAIVSPL